VHECGDTLPLVLRLRISVVMTRTETTLPLPLPSHRKGSGYLTVPSQLVPFNVTPPCSQSQTQALLFSEILPNFRTHVSSQTYLKHVTFISHTHLDLLDGVKPSKGYRLRRPSFRTLIQFPVTSSVFCTNIQSTLFIEHRQSTFFPTDKCQGVHNIKGPGVA
jgi:hypothetical protein